MALVSVCPKGNCNSTSFESVVQEIKNYKFKLTFIRCSVCGAVISTKEYYNIGAVIGNLAKKMGFDLEL